jgi:hypothetical protein
LHKNLQIIANLPSLGGDLQVFGLAWVHRTGLIENLEKLADRRVKQLCNQKKEKKCRFVGYADREETDLERKLTVCRVVLQLNGYEVRKGKGIAILPSLNNHRLFVGNIPKNRDREELFEEFTKHARK